MADGIIRRIVRLVLDRVSAKRTADDARRELGRVEDRMGGLERMAKRVGAALVAAFGIRAIIRFGREAVRQAQEAEEAWTDLRGTIEAAGESYERLEGRLRDTGMAFQDATRYSDEDYARSLSRLITISGDVGASINNMGLVANVAAQFFRGDLAGAVELVSKVMNGNLTLLNRMGIRVKTAQEGLEVLARRSFGAAERQAATFSGKLAQLNNLWGEFQEQLGDVLITSGQTRGALDVVLGVVRALIGWVDRNRDALRRWIDTGVSVAITFVDALIRSLLGMGEMFTGAWMTGFGNFVIAWAKFGKVLLFAAEAMTFLPRFFGEALGFGNRPSILINRLQAETAALEEWARTIRTVGMDTVRQGLGRFATPLFTPPAAGAGGAISSGTPQTGGNAPGAGDPELEERLRRIAAARAIQEALRRGVEQDLEDERTQLERRAKMHEEFGEIVAEGYEREMEMHAALRAELAATGDVATEVGGILAAVMGGQDIGPYAAGKAKQNLLEAAELGVRALTSAISPFTAWQAPLYAGAALKHAAVAAGWAALSAAAGGSGRGAPSAGGGGSIGGLSAARGSNASASQRAEPKTEVHLHLEGPGFDALQPRVQRVVYGAMQQARERFGDDAVIHLHRG
jgi:hypothetical protein